MAAGTDEELHSDILVGNFGLHFTTLHLFRNISGWSRQNCLAIYILDRIEISGNFVLVANNRHLMTGLKGNSEFCFPSLSRGSRGNKTHYFLRDQSLSVMLYLPNKKRKKLQRNRSLDAGPAGSQNLPRFQGTRPDHVKMYAYLIYISC